MTVKVFIASEAVNLLLDSKWASGKSKSDILFTNRQSCVSYLNRLLLKGMFHRASKVEKKKVKTKDEIDEPGDEKKLKKREKKKEKTEKPEKEEGEKKEVEKKDDKKKKEKKLRLRMHDDQKFCDGDEVYVWIYDPTNIMTFMIGLLLVLGSIALCLFPLWPPEVRLAVYYLSLAGAVFIGCILCLAVVRLILFCIVWVATNGKHHFWFLPNLTEDVGFMDSFRPLYKHEISAKFTEKISAKAEEAGEENVKEKEEIKPVSEKDDEGSTSKSTEGDRTGRVSEEEETGRLSEEEKMRRSSDGDSTGSENGYELVDRSDVTE